MNAVTNKLASLNTIYEAELKESNNHIKKLNQFSSDTENDLTDLPDLVASTSVYCTTFASTATCTSCAK